MATSSASRAARRGPVRYAVVGLGHIAQVAMLPAFAHARRNSRLTAIVSRDAVKRREIARRYNLEGVFSYGEYDTCLEQVDAVYIALPNSMHAEYAIRAARAGVHVLCEKPLAVTTQECEAMVNAARNLFRAEPKEAMAVSVNSGTARLRDVDESTAAILRFDGERVASFVTSFNADDVAAYRIVGTKGQIHVEPAFEYAEGLAYTLTVNGRQERKRIGKRDQFAPELLYFSDCILQNREPEPSGEEGLQDVRIVEALYESADSGKAMLMPRFVKRRRPTGRQRIDRPGVSKPRLVHVHSASED